MDKILIAAMLLGLGATHAQAGGPDCASEASVRAAAKTVEAQQIIPLRGHAGRPYLLMVFRSGDGVVVAGNTDGCFGSAIGLTAEGIDMVLKRTQAL